MSFEENSYGIIPLTFRYGQWEVFLVKAANAHHWGFPKGKAEKNESSMKAATRELYEETGLSIVQFLTEAPLVDEYEYVRDERVTHKKILFYIAKTTTAHQIDGKEIIDGGWFSLNQAEEVLTYEGAKSLMRVVKEMLPDID